MKMKRIILLIILLTPLVYAQNLSGGNFKAIPTISGSAGNLSSNNFFGIPMIGDYLIYNFSVAEAITPPAPTTPSEGGGPGGINFFFVGWNNYNTSFIHLYELNNTLRFLVKTNVQADNATLYYKFSYGMVNTDYYSISMSNVSGNFMVAYLSNVNKGVILSYYVTANKDYKEIVTPYYPSEDTIIWNVKPKEVWSYNFTGEIPFSICEVGYLFDGGVCKKRTFLLSTYNFFKVNVKEIMFIVILIMVSGIIIFFVRRKKEEKKVVA